MGRRDQFIAGSEEETQFRREAAAFDIATAEIEHEGGGAVIRGLLFVAFRATASERFIFGSGAGEQF